MTEFVQYVVQALSLGGLYALLALGVALVFSVGGIANFAHGQLIALAMYAVVATDGLSWPVTVVAALVVPAVLAVGMEAVVFRPARGASGDTLLILSFALALAIEAIVLVVIGADAKSTSFGSSLANPLHLGSISIPVINLVTLGVAMVSLVGLVYLVRRTLLGKRLRAASEDFEMARLVGVPANSVMRAAFALSGVLAGIAGLLLIVTNGVVTPDSGLQPVLVAFIATVIGGMGSLVGAACGGLLLGILTVALLAILPAGVADYRDAILFALVVGLLVLRPSGISSTAARQERI